MYNEDIHFNYIMLSTNHELVSHLTTEYSSFVEKKAGSHCWLLRKVEAGLHQLKLLEWRCSRTAWNLKKCTTVTTNMLWTGEGKVISLPINQCLKATHSYIVKGQEKLWFPQYFTSKMQISNTK